MRPSIFLRIPPKVSSYHLKVASGSVERKCTWWKPRCCGSCSNSIREPKGVTINANLNRPGTSRISPCTVAPLAWARATTASRFGTEKPRWSITLPSLVRVSPVPVRNMMRVVPNRRRSVRPSTNSPPILSLYHCAATSGSGTAMCTWSYI